MSDYLHTKEAAKLVGRSEVTLKRILNKVDQSNDQSMSNRLIFKKEKANRGYSWFIQKESLFQYFNVKSNDRSTIDHEKYSNQSKDSSNNQLIDSLKDQIVSLKEQLIEKDQQIARLHVLLQQSQEQKPQIDHQPEQKTGVFSRALMKFGL